MGGRVAASASPRTRPAGVIEPKFEPPRLSYEPVAVIETESAPAKAAAEGPLIDAPADDLTRMVGIGRKLSEALAARGVTQFAQIAAWKFKDLAEVDEALGLRGRAVRDAWVAQAKRLAEAL
jgi:predicted flap endonuclease-1-like 5' DNA nuclease